MAYLVMEYLPGITLRELLREQRRAHARSRRSTIMDADALRASPPRTGPASCTATSSPRTCCSPTTAASRSATSASRAPTSANTATGRAAARHDRLPRPRARHPRHRRRPQRHLRARHHAVRDARRRAAVQGRAAHADRLPARERLGAAAERQEPGRSRAARRARAVGDREAPGRPARRRAARCSTGCARSSASSASRPQVARTRSRPASIRDEVARRLGRRSTAGARPAPIDRRRPPTVGDADNATRSARARPSAARRKGGWLIALVVLLLAALAAGAGWWFGSGPGSLVAIAGCRAAAASREAQADRSPSSRFDGRRSRT